MRKSNPSYMKYQQKFPLVNFFSIISVLTLFMIAGKSAFAENEKLNFIESTYNFGTVNEKGGSVKHRFLFINEGSQAVKIQSAKASCGCTTPTWVRKAVFPGDTGYVDAIYDPANRPGNFNKTVTIYFEKTLLKKELRIKGFVQPPMTTPVKVYKQNIGNLRIKSKYMNLGQVKSDEPKTEIFNVYNQRNTEMTLSIGEDLPPHISVTFEPKTIKAKQVGNIRITYDASKDTQFGMTTSVLKLKTNDNITPIKQIHINAQVQENFTEAMKADPNRPILSLDKKDIYLGSIQDGESITTVFTYKNAGNTPLLIRSVFTSCSCVAFQSKKTKIKPGATGKIKITFDSTGKFSYVRNEVTMITNDPNNPIQKVSVRAKVTRPK